MHHYEGKPVGMWPARKLKSKWEQNIKINPTYIGCKDVQGIEVVLFCLVMSFGVSPLIIQMDGWFVCLFVCLFIHSFKNMVWGIFFIYFTSNSKDE
jgi:hypothetical protein